MVEGVTGLCVDPPACVVGRRLDGNQLSGSIPVELGQLTALSQLYVYPFPTVGGESL